MKIEQLASIQKLIEKIEEEKATGKIILFFHDGELGGVEVDRKIKIVMVEAVS